MSADLTGTFGSGERFNSPTRSGDFWLLSARGNLAVPLVRLGENERPEHLVFRLRRIDRGDAHLGDVCVEHVGAVRRRIAPAGKGFRQGVIAGADVFHRHGGVEAGFLDALLERPPGVVIELIARRHDAGLLGGKPHQFGIERHRAEAVIAAIARDHRLRRIGVERGVGRGEIDIKTRLARRRARVGAAAERGNAKQSAADHQRGQRPVHAEVPQCVARLPRQSVGTMNGASPGAAKSPQLPSRSQETQRRNSMADASPAARTPGAKRAGPGEYIFNLANVNHILGGPDYSTANGACVEGDRMIRRAHAHARRHRRRAAFASERAMDLHPRRHLSRHHRRQDDRGQARLGGLCSGQCRA